MTLIDDAHAAARVPGIHVAGVADNGAVTFRVPANGTFDAIPMDAAIQKLVFGEELAASGRFAVLHPDGATSWVFPVDGGAAIDFGRVRDAEKLNIGDEFVLQFLGTCAGNGTASFEAGTRFWERTTGERGAATKPAAVRFVTPDIATSQPAKKPRRADDATPSTLLGDVIKRLGKMKSMRMNRRALELFSSRAEVMWAIQPEALEKALRRILLAFESASPIAPVSTATHFSVAFERIMKEHHFD